MGRSHLRAFQAGAGAGAWGPRVQEGPAGGRGHWKELPWGARLHPSVKLSALCPASHTSHLSGLLRGGNDNGSETLNPGAWQRSPSPSI